MICRFYQSFIIFTQVFNGSFNFLMPQGKTNVIQIPSFFSSFLRKIVSELMRMGIDIRFLDSLFNMLYTESASNGSPLFFPVNFVNRYSEFIRLFRLSEMYLTKNSKVVLLNKAILYSAFLLLPSWYWIHDTLPEPSFFQNQYLRYNGFLEFPLI